MLKKTILLLAGIPAITCCLFSQSLPDQWSIDEVNHRLTIGGKWDTDVYQTDMVHEMQMEFSQSNWWTLLTNNYNSGTDLSGTLTIDGTTYEQVGIRFKGQTSYMMTIGEEKKSFNISMDSFIDGQDHDGFTVFNLNNCFEDPSFMKEFLYLYHIRTHVPAARASYVHLTINGENWGVYPCVEGMNGPYIKDWFLSNDGTRWRADAPNAGFGGGGGGGPQWGDGTAAVNWLGSDQSEYEQYYTLKSSTVADPWANLIETCDVLNNTPNAELVNELPAVLDIDRTLWFLACENAFGDDDSYIFKGKMDYYLYWEIETGRMTPLEYDGNSILVNESMSWGPFYHATDADYPLLYELLAIPEWRQRYLAHLRTILETSMDADLNAALIEQHSNMITDFVEADDKKLYSFSQFNSGVSGLEEDIQTRKGTIMSNSEVNTTGATISDVVMSTTGGEWANPQANETVNIIVSVASPDGINSVWLYFAEGLVGNFTRVTMADDGTLGDGAAGDGVYGAQIPGMQEGALVRFYVEARENNAALTATYMPEGAEHDVFYYIVTAPYAAETDVVINEIMAINATGFLVDETGSDEDWIELYNKSNAAVDLTGFALTDNLL
ncbi:MAG: CotH kinase family protein, partial [Flavobacteriales bacterium]|nr:CotH kinase family protein [Flavobacteriales bacterium]